MTTTQTPAQQIEALEDEYSAMGSQANEHPERWGGAQEAVLARLAAKLQALYDRHDVHEYDRVAL